MKPLTSQLAHRGFCSSHFRRLFRQVRQPVLTLCLPAGVGFRGIMLDYSVHNPRRGKWKKQNGRSVASIPPEQCSDLLRRAPSKTCKGESIQPGKWGGPKKAGQFDQKMRLAPLRVGFFFLSRIIVLLWSRSDATRGQATIDHRCLILCMRYE